MQSVIPKTFGGFIENLLPKRNERVDTENLEMFILMQFR